MIPYLSWVVRLHFQTHYLHHHLSMLCYWVKSKKPSYQLFTAFDSTYDGFLKEVQQLPGGFVPELDYPHLPEIAKATDSLLPARSHILTPHTELRNMFLIEGERGCHRSCTFCVMRRSTNGGMRLVTPDRLMSFVPEHAKRVGL